MKLHKRIFRTSTILVMAVVTAIGTCQLASAAPVAGPSVSAANAVAAVVPPQPTDADRALAAKIHTVARGGTLVIPATAARPSLTFSESAAGMLMHRPRQDFP